MSKLEIFVCENFSPEFIKIVKKEGFDKVNVKSYPTLCDNKNNHPKVRRILEKSLKQGNDIVIFCSKYCSIVDFISEKSAFKVVKADYCFNHLADSKTLDYVFNKGGYIIGLGWLNNWREHIGNMGFSQDTAKRFYHESCRELFFFDPGIDSNAQERLEELSGYLDLPSRIIPFEIDSLEAMLRSIFSEWRLYTENMRNSKAVSEAQKKCAEYASILDILGKLTTCENKREAIDKIKEIFIVIFGAKKFEFHSRYSEIKDIPEIINDAGEMRSLLFKEENRMYICINQKDKHHGVIEAGDFIFPQYIDRYYNFAVSISKVCALILTNIEHYEELVKYKEDLEYISYHDELTGLYNRTYFNKMFEQRDELKNIAIFSFDIDGLKQMNDNFGHVQGDRLIVSASEILKKCFRETDIIARIGGDEFISIVPECNQQKAEMIRKRIIEATAEHNSAVSISVGYALEKSEEDNLEELMKKADDLMYIDKGKKKIRKNI